MALIIKMKHSSLFEVVKDTIDNLSIDLPDLTAVRHGVEFRDIANELWHLMFGAANEYLVNKGFYAKPEYRAGEGRYLQCIHYR